MAPTSPDNFPIKSSAGPCSLGKAAAFSANNKTSYILVVTRNGHMAEPVMEYAVNVADRLKYAILAVHTNTQPFFRDGGRRSRLFTGAMEESAALFRKKAGLRDIMVEHLGATGKIGKIVKGLCHSDKHIEFVILDQGIRLEEVNAQSPVPVFRVIYTRPKRGEMTKNTYPKPIFTGDASMSATSKKRHVKNCFVFGALTAGLYAAVFTHSEMFMSYLTKGGLNALLPVAVVLAVSYVHGNFTNSFWSALGIEGSKIATPKQADIRQDNKASAGIRKDLRPRAEISI
jgi:hypothetical protein